MTLRITPPYREEKKNNPVGSSQGQSGEQTQKDADKEREYIFIVDMPYKDDARIGAKATYEVGKVDTTTGKVTFDTNDTKTALDRYATKGNYTIGTTNVVMTTYKDKYLARDINLLTTDIANIENLTFKFRKVDAKVDSDGIKPSLAGAKFNLLYSRDKDGEKSILTLYEKGSGENIERIWLEPEEKVPQGFSKVKDTFESADKTGLVEFLDLSKPGYYAVKEIQAPKGFAKPLSEDQIVKAFEIKDGKLYLLDDGKSYEQKDDGFYYSKVESAGNYLRIKKENINNALAYTWTINSGNQELTYKDAKMLFAGDIPANANLKIKVYANQQVTPNAAPNYTASLNNGELDLTTYLNVGLVKPKENSETDKSEETKPNPKAETKSTSKIEITYEVTPQVTDEKPEIEMNFKSSLIGIKDNFVEINDYFKFSKGDGYTEIDSTNTEYEARYVDEKLVQTDDQGNLQVENRKVELPAAFGTKAWIGFTIGGLAVMLGGVFIHFKRKEAIGA